VSSRVPWLQTRSWCGRALASPRATGSATQQGRAPVSPRVPWLQTRLPVQKGSGVATCGRVHCPAGKGSGVTTCLVASDSPPGAGGLWHRPMPPGPSPSTERLRCRYVFYDPRPASRCGRALTSPHALWLSASEACSCVPKASDIRLIMASPGTWSRQHIKYVQDKTYATYG
jgi:hypothetical protein